MVDPNCSLFSPERQTLRSAWDPSSMDDVTRVDTAAVAAVNRKAVSGLGRSGGPHSLVRRALRAFIHFFSYHFILSRQNIRVSYAGGFRLTVRPTVFHPKFFIS